MAPSRAATDQAARIRTFLIADIRGYTSFNAQRGDEAASQLARTFAEVATQGVEAWAGTLVELRGDEALAVFDSPRAALRAAVELQAAFADETAANPDLPLAVGMGLDAGEAVPTGDGYRGAALNLAARLSALAAGGEIVASAEVVHLAGAAEGLTYEPLDPVSVKGLDRAVAAFRVGGPDRLFRPGGAVAAGGQARPSVLPPDLDPIVPLAGRERELRWLAWHWRRAGHGSGRAVVLAGPPGIGKTRLSAELAVAAHAAGATVRYLPGGKVLSAEERQQLSRLVEGPSPLLLVVDDLDAAPPRIVDAVTQLARDLDGRPALLLVTHRETAPASLITQVERFATRERRHSLEPLEPDDVRAIAALYAGSAVADVPLSEIMAESAGVPAAVHRVASRWAGTAARGRLGASADRTAAGRQGLRAAEAQLIGDVADLGRAQDRARLYAAEREFDAATSTTDGYEDALAVCPYKGLATFDAADAEYFFGRERLVAELVARMVGSSFLGLIGASGSGKSSALRAGLMPSLAAGVLPGSERWPQQVLRPGEQPLAELNRALVRAFPEHELPRDDAVAALDAAMAVLAPGQRLVLVIDQFEEVFNATRTETERSAFIDLLTSERNGLSVVVSLRADHYGHCAAYPELARLLAANQVLVGPLTPRELAAVIEHPAQRVGLRAEPELVEALVNDVGTEPGALPLLSTALLELWQARDGRRLTLAAYRASGGVRGAVARLAEQAYAKLNPAQRDTTRAIFLRLAGTGEGEGVVRRRVPLAELDADRDAAVAVVLQLLTGARLLTTGDGYVEVAHEALLREWPRLQEWLSEDAAGHQVRLHLIGAARDWDQRGREQAELYRGARLAAALDWLAEHAQEPNALERAFLDESRAASERDADRQRRLNRRLRLLLAGAGVFLLVAVGAGVYAVSQLFRAEGESARAEEQASLARQEAEAAVASQQLARARELIASAQVALADDPSLAKLLAVAGAGVVEPDLATERTLHEVWARDKVIDRFAWPDEEFVWTELDPSGELIVSSFPTGGSDPERVEVVDRRSRAVLWRYEPPPQVTVGPLYFTVDGKSVVASLGWDPGDEQPAPLAPADLGVHVWDARTGRLVNRFDAGGCGGEAIGISTSWVVVNGLQVDEPTPEACFENGPQPVTLVDLATGERRVVAETFFGDFAISRDGRFVALSDAEAEIAYVLDVATGERVLEFNITSTGQLNTFVRSLSHDGGMLLYGDRPMQTWDVATGSVVASFGGNSGESFFAHFALEEETVYVTTRDGAFRKYDARSGLELFALPAVGGGHAAISRIGVSLVMDEATWTGSVVDEQANGEIGTVDSDCSVLTLAGSLQIIRTTAVYSTICEFGSYKSSTYVVQVDGAQSNQLAAYAGAASQDVELSPDATQFAQQEIAAESSLTPVRIRDVSTGELVRELDGLCTWDQLALEPSTDCPVYPETPFRLWAPDIEWSPDGRFVAAQHEWYEEPAYLAVWDASSGQLVHSEPPPDDLRYFSLKFTPDSKQLITVAGDYGDRGRIRVLSTENWQVVDEFEPDPSLDGRGRIKPAGFLDDGSTLVLVSNWAGNSGGWLARMNMATHEVLGGVRAGDAAPKSLAMLDDGSLLAIGGADGVVRIWEPSSSTLLHELSVDGQAQGVAFVNEQQIAVAPNEGGLLMFTVDRAELLDTVRRSLTRGFTAAECQRYGLDPCPTLEEMRGD